MRFERLTVVERRSKVDCIEPHQILDLVAFGATGHEQVVTGGRQDEADEGVDLCRREIRVPRRHAVVGSSLDDLEEIHSRAYGDRCTVTARAIRGVQQRSLVTLGGLCCRRWGLREGAHRETDRPHQQEDGDARDHRSAGPMPPRRAIDPGKRHEESQCDHRDHEHAEHLEIAREVLEELEEEQEIPLGPRRVIRIARVGDLLEARADEDGEADEHDEHDQRNHCVLEDGVGEERDALLLGLRVLLAVMRFLFLLHVTLSAWGCGDAVSDDQIQVDRYEQYQQRRQHPDVGTEESRERQAGDLVASKHEVSDEPPDDRHHLTDPGTHHRCPIGPLVPWQQIAGESEGERDQQQCDTGDPGDFSRILVGAIHDDPDHVQDRQQHHGARPPVMQTADQPAEREVVGDVGDTGVGLSRLGDVVDGEEDSRDELNRDGEEGRAAERVGPVDLGDLAKEDRRPVAAPSGPLIEPVGQSGRHLTVP